MLKSSIVERYKVHNRKRICQGDILRDFNFIVQNPDDSLSEISFPYVIILTQDCDLEQRLKINTSNGEKLRHCNSFLPNILVLPAFLSKNLREGNYLEELYSIQVERKNSGVWSQIQKNMLDRYHYIDPNRNLQIPELSIDFKIYFSLPYSVVKKDFQKIYLATLNELFREKLSQRFANYISRIGLPKLP